MKSLVALGIGLLLAALSSGCCCTPCGGGYGCGYGGGGCGPGGCPSPAYQSVPAGAYYSPPCNGSCAY